MKNWRSWACNTELCNPGFALFKFVTNWLCWQENMLISSGDEDTAVFYQRRCSGRAVPNTESPPIWSLHFDHNILFKLGTGLFNPSESAKRLQVIGAVRCYHVIRLIAEKDEHPSWRAELYTNGVPCLLGGTVFQTFQTILSEQWVFPNVWNFVSQLLQVLFKASNNMAWAFYLYCRSPVLSLGLKAFWLRCFTLRIFIYINAWDLVKSPDHQSSRNMPNYWEPTQPDNLPLFSCLCGSHHFGPAPLGARISSLSTWREMVPSQSTKRFPRRSWNSIVTGLSAHGLPGRAVCQIGLTT